MRRLLAILAVLWITLFASTQVVHAGAHTYDTSGIERVGVQQVKAVGVGTTTAGAVIHTYDVRTIARVDVHGLGAVEANRAQASGSREGSASCPRQAHGISVTTSVVCVATNTAGLADEGFISPSSVRFSQNSVSPNFSAGGSIDDLAVGLRNGSIAPGDVPQIRIFESDGQWMTLDNRRLVAFQQAGVDVPYRLATAEEIAAQAWKVTTTNGGTSITIRGGGGSWPR